MKQILITTLILFLFYQCKNDEKTCVKTNSNVELIPVDTIIIDVDTVSLSSYAIYDYCSSDSLLYNYNEKTHSIDIISLNKRKFYKRIKLYIEGPNEIPEVTSLKVINNLIYITAENYNCIYLINKKAQVIKKYNFNNLQYNNIDFIIRGDNIFNAKIYIQGNKLFSYIYTFSENNKNIALIYDIKENKIINLYCDIPEEYSTNYYSSLETPSFIVNKETTIIAYPPLDYIDIYNNKTGKIISSICAKSKYARKLDVLDNNIDMQQEADFLNEQPYYFALMYDKFNNIYYRIYKHKMDLLNNLGELNPRFSGKSSVIIFDDKLRIIGEKLLPKGLLFPYAFVTEEGLNIYIPTNNEHKIAFVCFNLNNK